MIIVSILRVDTDDSEWGRNKLALPHPAKMVQLKDKIIIPVA